MQFVRKSLFAAVLLSVTALSTATVSAETITGALIKAYQLNSSFNSARAGARATDENVAIAKSGYRPVIVGTGSINYSSTSVNPRDKLVPRTSPRLTTGSFGIEIQQTLFDGFQTKNNVHSAEAQVQASFENLRNTEMNTLFNAASAYMDVIRDRRIAVLTEQNLEFLNEQARAARSRLEVGEGTRTDVAQADASRSEAVAQLAAARANALASAANYRAIVGEDPGNLKPAAPLAKLLPKSADAAYGIAESQHPAILSAQHVVDAAGFAVKSAEGQLLPQITGVASVDSGFANTQPFSPSIALPGGGSFGGVNNSGSQNGTNTSASIGAQINIPLYQGGRVSAQVRQAKEQLGQARIDVDVSRDQVRQAVTSAWTSYTAARENVTANRETVAATQLALNGVIEERNVGQRTTLDVLNAQQDVITAQVNLASSERDVVVGSYAILSAIGALGVKRLGLQVAEYKPQEHYNAVKDKWFGLRTPDGR